MYVKLETADELYSMIRQFRGILTEFEICHNNKCIS